MRQWIVYFIVLLGVFHTAHAQQVKGTVIDDQKAPVPFASVALLNLPDSSLAAGSVTDIDGEFSIKAPAGNYVLNISFLGYLPTFKAVSVANKNISLGNITLTPNSEQLEAVEITAEKSQMELKLDKRVFNVEKDLTNQGGSATDVLENVPSVTVDVDGNINLRGSSNVRIFINGKPSGLTGISTSEALQQLPSDLIEKVEVITNPSARYEAEGEVGIINIVLKKERRSGLNGSGQLTVGYPHLYGASVQLNHKKEKTNLFGSYAFRSRNAPGYGREVQAYDSPDTSYEFRNNRDHYRGGISHNFRMGSEFFLNDKNTLTFTGMYSHSDGENGVNRVYEDLASDGTLFQRVTRDLVEKEPENVVEASLNYRKTFDQKDRVLTANLQYFINDEDELADITQVNERTGEETLQSTSNTEDENNFLFQIDYVHPFAERYKYELGAKTTHRVINNQFKVEELVNNEWSTLGQFDNHFLYEEFIQASYGMFSAEWDKFGMQLGARAEYTDVNSQLVTTNESSPQEYLNFFPSSHFSYKLDSSNTIQLSYSRRLSRPRFRSLLPFYSFTDPRDFYRGNPNLQPEYTDAFEIGHLYYFKKGSLMSSVYYRHRTNVVERVLTTDSAGLSTSYPVNLAQQNAVGIELNANYDLYDWWQVTGSGNFYRAITEGSYQGNRLFSDTYTWQANLTTNFKIGKKIKSQWNVLYEAPRVTTQGSRKGMYSINAGIGIKLFKNKGNLSLNVRDLFNTRIYRGITETGYFTKNSEFQWRSRQFTLNLTYRLKD